MESQDLFLVQEESRLVQVEKRGANESILGERVFYTIN